MSQVLRLVIRTPHDVPFDGGVGSIRVPTETGQVGLRPREEPLLLAVEPGLILLRTGTAVRFAASAGGLVEATRESAVLYTPFAVVGRDAEHVVGELEEALATPDSEIAARRRLGELEERIVEELRRRPPIARAREDHAGS